MNGMKMKLLTIEDALLYKIAATERLPAVLAQRAQRSERFIDMLLGGELREADVTDHSPPVDDERYAPWQPERRGYSVALSDQAVLVAQQWKGELVRCGKLLVRLDRVRADADDFRSCIHEEFVAIAEGARLGGADGRVVPRVEVQDDILLTKKIPEAYRGAREGRQGKVRSRLAHLHPAPGRLCLTVVLAHGISISFPLAIAGAFRSVDAVAREAMPCHSSQQKIPCGS